MIRPLVCVYVCVCDQGLWNLFMMEEGVYHSGLKMAEYAVMSEVGTKMLYRHY
jgi:hypothetical protein